MQINSDFLRLPGGYLFSEINRRVAAYTTDHPDVKLIKLGIGDVTRPLPEAVLSAMHRAVNEMGRRETFRGYGPEQGYEFLRRAIVFHDYLSRGVKLDVDEVFVSDGAKSDCGNIVDLFGQNNIIALSDPIYPVYLDSNIMSGRAGEYDNRTGRWSNLVYMPCSAENGYIPEEPRCKVDLIYMCFPNNPTGATITCSRLKQWVDYANANDSVILYDSAYEAFIDQEDIPHSIFEIEGAKSCAIEFRSFSKTAGFTGVRCAYTVIPKQIQRSGISLNAMWNRRQCTKFNGVSYVTQRGAEAVYSPEGKRQVRANLCYYKKNAKMITDGLKRAGLTVSGGANSPYIWCKVPRGMASWEFFDCLLNRANVVTTPGAGFGPSGEGHIRLSAFGDTAETEEAVERIVSVL